MYNLYENIYALCKERGITPGGLCGELGFRRSVLSDLKNGRKKSLDTTTLMKIAEYFNVSVDYLLTGEETKKAPTQEDEREITFDDFTFAMQNESKDLTEADKQILLSMAKQLNDARKKRNGESK
ncbi:helix-turn-helix domain-containing protein [Muriventricola aceti]|jgi:transcriptional regulator with XRE-family HTH domain|uniref:helix-turn-helix domain-containing protein n=1 Tax=Muriventricola aceti TaxID=2981773 RepID=UPI000820FDA0|nr:helix-turn-helix transcriptional regulator [Muriventricola aceti]MCU6702430.1 helix-turn-helix domain-containing protein [Muriventricola aceti]SCJ03592.1 Helix-turn-helix domain [uncultured Flavonifractor sp.]DAP34115.1 MAG TPA: repressor protein [Caudoviricetes sp.]